MTTRRYKPAPDVEQLSAFSVPPHIYTQDQGDGYWDVLDGTGEIISKATTRAGARRHAEIAMKISAWLHRTFAKKPPQ